ncbi:hypothetical protein SAMN05444972_11466 [Marininema halotolerans]|uniref:Uncharacterized protein n=1 Tax=Marininema halotolerans TaxID=1155944 RepID=A0A1I6U9C7_9BACL|nr:hypothetical protein SAMN05444972_11466 [Marininema halotolerans]
MILNISLIGGVFTDIIISIMNIIVNKRVNLPSHLNIFIHLYLKPSDSIRSFLYISFFNYLSNIKINKKYIYSDQ